MHVDLIARHPLLSTPSTSGYQQAPVRGRDRIREGSPNNLLFNICRLSPISPTLSCRSKRPRYDRAHTRDQPLVRSNSRLTWGSSPAHTMSYWSMQHSPCSSAVIPHRLIARQTILVEYPSSSWELHARSSYRQRNVREGLSCLAQADQRIQGRDFLMILCLPKKPLT